MKLKYWASRLFAVVFEYETLKIVSINSKKIALLCRLIQLIIIGYVIGFVIIYKKGYQESEMGVSGLISKVKGVSYSNRSNVGGMHVWDVADYVIPPQEKDAFFITTNALITRKQTQGSCPEDKNIDSSNCSTDSNCTAFEPILLGDGVKTGKCNNGTNTCEIYAWCPVENSAEDSETIKSPLLKNVANFTILIKNTVQFVNFKVTRANIPPEYDKSKLSTCRYDPVKDPKCPIFEISSILRMAKTTYDDIASIGGVIEFSINWDCNLDLNSNNCYPKYMFRRLDDKNANISKGWNFRYANYYYINETQYRDLIKAYGIRFVISVTSKAGKFNIVPLTMNIGSGVALLGIATIICDFFVIYFLKKREQYREAKYYRISGDDAYEPMLSESENIP